MTPKWICKHQSGSYPLALILLSLALILAVPNLSAQELIPPPMPPVSSDSGDTVSLEMQLQQPSTQLLQFSASSSVGEPEQSAATPNDQNSQQTGEQPAAQGAQNPAPPPQPKRILGIMPNFRAVSAGVLPPPPTPKEAFMVATRNSFDYSAFVFVGITSLLSEGTDAHSQLGKGVAGYGRYYWRGYLDKTDGNYWVDFVMPTIFHQDERYYALGKGGLWKRAFYSASRIFVTPDDHGHNSFNASELVGRGISQAISLAYYPSQTRTAGGIATKYGWAIGRDMLTNVFREFWPDIAVHVLHRHP